MKFFRERSLKVQAAFILSFFTFILITEFLILRGSVTNLEELHYQRDFARKAQLTVQEIMLKMNSLFQDNNLEAEILSQVEQHDHMLEVLSTGGRLDGSSIFIGKLQDLPAISLHEVDKHWLVFKQQAQQSMLTSEKIGTEKKMLDARWITLSSWYDKLISDMDVVMDKARSALALWIVFLIALNIGLLIFLFMLFRKYVISPLTLLKENTAKHIHTTGLPANEMGSVATCVNETIEQLKDGTQFIQEIGKGNLNIRYHDLDSRYESGKNKLADSLIEMQSKLKELNVEEQQRQWANDGLAKFIDILRNGGDSIHALGDKIIANLINYTRSNQGGLYLLNDDDKNNLHLETIALFAFDTKKFEVKKIKLGEGILGQTFLEKETTYLTDIPQEFIRITSGLGDANPKSLLVVPLKIDQEIYGVVELASFNDYKDHEIKFVERLSETIASAFASVKSAQKNRALLEESTSATEMMRAQEEEMRQNMEELQATQEEMARKEKNYIEKISLLEKKSTQGSSAELETSKKEVERLTLALEQCKGDLVSAHQKHASTDEDWAIVEEVEKTLKINLEALKITKEEMGQRPDA